MYIALAWEPTGNDDVEGDIDTALATLGFKNSFKPVPGYVLANTPGNTMTKVDDLQTELRKLEITFTISATPKGWLMWRSTDVSAQTCKKIADHAD